jgi:hypothetical protein
MTKIDIKTATSIHEIDAGLRDELIIDKPFQVDAIGQIEAK